MDARLTSLPRRLAQAAGLGLGALGWTGGRPLTGPIYAQVSATDLCNFRCAMCGYHPPEGEAPVGQFGGRPPGTLPLDVYRRVVADLAALGSWQLDLVGRGEPLLHPDIAEMVAVARRQGLTVTLTTNGSRLTGERARALLASGLDRLRVSVNVGTPETYPRIHVNRTAREFGRVIDNARRLTDRKRAIGAATHVSAAFVVGAPNCGELTGMVEAAAAMGADAAHFQFGVRMAGAELPRLSGAQHRDLVDVGIPAAMERARSLGLQTDLAALQATTPGYRFGDGPASGGVVPCYIGYFFAIVLGNGSVVPCCQTQRSLGNVADDGFAAIWRGEAYRRFRRAARGLPAPDPALATCECDDCFFRPHNVTVHNLLHPASRIPPAQGGKPIGLFEMLRLSRLED